MNISFQLGGFLCSSAGWQHHGCASGPGVTAAVRGSALLPHLHLLAWPQGPQVSLQSMAPSPLQARWLHTAPQPAAVLAAAVLPVAQSLARSQGFGCASTVLSGKMVFKSYGGTQLSELLL